MFRRFCSLYFICFVCFSACAGAFAAEAGKSSPSIKSSPLSPKESALLIIFGAPSPNTHLVVKDGSGDILDILRGAPYKTQRYVVKPGDYVIRLPNGGAPVKLHAVAGKTSIITVGNTPLSSLSLAIEKGEQKPDTKYISPADHKLLFIFRQGGSTDDPGPSGKR